MFKKGNRLTIILLLVLLAFLFGYGPAIIGLTNTLGARLNALSPVAILLIGVAIGKFLL